MMMLCFAPLQQCLCRAPPRITANKKTPNRRKIKNPNHPFPKSRPTPLFIDRNHQPQSELEALKSVITNLETTIHNGVSVDDPQIFASLLEACFQLRATEYASRIHGLIPPKLLRRNAGVASKLLRLYACSGEVEQAHEVFDVMPGRNFSAFPWNALISGYAEARRYDDAMALYFQMVEEGMEPDEYTYPRVLKACGGIGMVRVGEEVHRHVIRSGYGNNAFISNALVDMYAKCGDIVMSRKVFDAIVGKELVSWNSMIVGYTKHGVVSEALSLLRRMMVEGCEPDSVTLSAILSDVVPYEAGVQVHGWVIRRGMERNTSVVNSLMLFYSGYKKMRVVRWLFEQMTERDVVSWNSIISAHAKDSRAIEYFERMVNESRGGPPDSITFVALLSACANLGLVKDGERILAMMVERYGMAPHMEHYNCMVHLYARAGLINEAYEVVVRRMGAEAGPAAWGALLYGCYLHGNAEVGEIAAGHLFELEPEGEHNFELLINIYHKIGRVEDVERVRGMMMERGLDM